MANRKFRVLDSVLAAGVPGGENADALGTAGHFAWVLDGATSLVRTAPTGPEEWARALSSAMAQEAGTAEGVADLAGRATRRAAMACGLDGDGDPSVLPSAAGIVAMIRGGTVEAASWGDCGGIVDTGKSATLHIEDGRIAVLDGFRRAEMERLGNADGGYSEESETYLQSLAIGIRSTLNRPWGYPALTPDGRGVGLARVVGGIRARRILLYSDGLAWAWGDFGIVSVDDVLSGRVGLAEALAELRSAEGRDSRCVSVRRFKPSDDAAGLLLTPADDG